MAASIAGAAISGGIGLAGKALGGGGSSSSDITPLLLSSGGFSSRLDGSRLETRTIPARRNLVNELSGLFRAQADEFGNLRPLVAPGIGRLTDARVSTLENRGERRLSNLRDSLARRRVLGSSFGQGQAQSELRQLDQDIAEVRARSFLEELDLTTQLIQQEFTSDIAAVDAQLQNMNLEAQFGLQLASGVQAALTNNSVLQSQLAIQNARGLGAFVEPFASAAGSGFENFLIDQFPETFGG